MSSVSVRTKAPKSLIYQSNLIFQSAPKSPVCIFHGGTFGKLPPKRLIYEAVFLRIFPKSPGCFTHVENQIIIQIIRFYVLPLCRLKGITDFLADIRARLPPYALQLSGADRRHRSVLRDAVRRKEQKKIWHPPNLVAFPEPPKRPPANIRTFCWAFSGYKMGPKKSTHCQVVSKKPFQRPKMGLKKSTDCQVVSEKPF